MNEMENYQQQPSYKTKPSQTIESARVLYNWSSLLIPLRGHQIGIIPQLPARYRKQQLSFR